MWGETRMKKSSYKRGLALVVCCFLAAGTCFSGTRMPFCMISYAEGRTASVNATNLNVRSGPGTNYAAVGKLSQGAPVTVIGEKTAGDGVLWYQIRFNGSGGAETTGYVSSRYIKFPVAITNDSDFEKYLNQQGFPESYKQGLRELHAQYPKWTFTAFKTNLDWNTVIQNESVIGRNLVSKDSMSSWKSTATGAYDWDNGTWPGFDGNSWVQASEDIIRYYMDPRNFINDKYVFQFLKQSYDSSIHTKEGLENMVSGTFLSGASAGGGGSLGNPSGSGSGTDNNAGATGPGATGPGAGATGGTSVTSPISPAASISSHTINLVTSYGPGMDAAAPGTGSNSGTFVSGSSSYVDILMNAAAQSGVNPYILASMILQEQGSQGTGRSISGTVSGYEGYYNFFNIEAYQSGSLSAVQRGLWWASQAGSYERPWNSVEKSILGGSIYYGNNYVKQGQNTLYLKKFNVQGSNLYKHQYMTNVQAAAAEGLSLSKINALKNTALEFSIPVYQNMPDSVCVKPNGDGSPNNKLSGLGVEGFALTPTFNRDTESYDLIVDSSVSSVTVAAAAIDSSAVLAGTGSVNLQSGNNEITVAVKASNGTIRNYMIHVVRQTNGPTYSSSVGGGITGGSTSGPGANSSGGPGSSRNDSSVEIINPPGSNAGSGVIAPDGSSINGFGKAENTSSIISAPGAVPAVNGGTLAATRRQVVLSGTTSELLASAITSSGMGSAVKVLSSGGKEVKGFVGTGNSAHLYGTDGSVLEKYEVVVKGDNTGDGKLDIMDVLKVQRHILGLETLEGLYKEASDVNQNGKIDIMDILAMQRDILGIQKLN